MKYKFQFLILLLFFYSIGNGQNYLTIEGKIRNLKNNNPIPLVHIYSLKNMTGSISNSLGKYTIRLPVSSNIDTIYISHLGYETGKIIIKTKQDTTIDVFLLEVPIVLSEVTIFPLTVEMIFDSLIAHVPDNYVDKAIILNAFLRDKNINKSKPISFNTGTSINEMALEIYKYPYVKCHKKRNQKDDVKLIAWRKIDSFKFARGLKIFAGGFESPLGYMFGLIPIHTANADILKSINKEFVYNRKWRKLYDYQLEGIVPWQNGTAYKISFEQKTKIEKQLYKGVLLIDLKTFALIFYEKYYSPKGADFQELENIPSHLHLASISEIKYMRTDYECINNKWYLRSYYSISKGKYYIYKNDASSVLFEDEYKNLDVLETETYNEITFVVTAISDSDVKKFKNDEVLKMLNVEVDEIEKDNENIWGNHNFIDASDIKIKKKEK